jgi:lysophospholipase L1-like esterase
VILVALALSAAACGDVSGPVSAADRPVPATEAPTAQPVVVWPPTSTTGAGGPTSTSAPPTRADTTSPGLELEQSTSPLRTPTATAPLRVLVVGDSVGFDASPGIQAALEATGAASVVLRAAPGVGLTTGLDVADWRAHWVADVAEVQPELVVLMTGALDVYAMRTDAIDLEAYRGLVDDALDILGAGGARVLVVGVLPQDVVSATYEEIAADRATRPFVNQILRTAAHDRDGRADFVLLDDEFSDDLGRFEFYVTGPDGSLVRARKADGLHICPDGAAIIGEAVVDAVTGWWALPPVDVAYRGGPWRLDSRYDYPADSCDVDPAVISGEVPPPPPWSDSAVHVGLPPGSTTTSPSTTAPPPG